MKHQFDSRPAQSKQPTAKNDVLIYNSNPGDANWFSKNNQPQNASNSLN